MGVIVQDTDFQAGSRYYIAQSAYESADINNFIDDHEEDTIHKLLGEDLGDLFIADINNTTHKPNTQIYTDIFDLGIKEILKAKVWLQFMAEQAARNTTSGNVQVEGDNAKRASFQIVYNKYNDSKKWWDKVQQYILEHSEDYPDYVGCEFELVHWALGN